MYLNFNKVVRLLIFVFFVSWFASSIIHFDFINKLNYIYNNLYLFDLIYLILVFFSFFYLKKINLNSLLIIISLFYFLFFISVSYLLFHNANILANARFFIYPILIIFLLKNYSHEDFKFLINIIILILYLLFIYTVYIRIKEYGIHFPKKSQLYRYDSFNYLLFNCSLISLLINKNNKNIYHFVCISLIFFYFYEGVRSIFFLFSILYFFFSVLFQKKFYFIIIFFIFLFFILDYSKFSLFFLDPLISLDGTLRVRLLAMAIAFDSFKESIFIGHGLGFNFGVEQYFQSSEGNLYIGSPHNTFLQLLTEVGIIGIFPLIIISFLIFKNKSIHNFHNFFIKIILVSLYIYYSLQPLSHTAILNIWVIIGLITYIQKVILIRDNLE